QQQVPSRIVPGQLLARLGDLALDVFAAQQDLFDVAIENLHVGCESRQRVPGGRTETAPAGFNSNAHLHPPFARGLAEARGQMAVSPGKGERLEHTPSLVSPSRRRGERWPFRAGLRPAPRPLRCDWPRGRSPVPAGSGGPTGRPATEPGPPTAPLGASCPGRPLRRRREAPPPRACPGTPRRAAIDRRS